MKSNPIEQDLNQFPGREEKLRSIPRFSLYAVMYYRSNLLSHTRHVAWLVRELAPLIQRYHRDFDPERAEALALVHDDAEMITGDAQAGNKLKMSPAELSALKEAELRAIEMLSRRYPKRVGGYVYRNLLMDSYEPHTIEAYAVKHLDKVDALGETLHELYGGNLLFVTNVRNQYGKILTPFEFYYEYFSSLPEQAPALRPLLGSGHPFFEQIPTFDRSAVVRGREHTLESLRRPTGHEHYDEWRRIILKHADPEELELLTTKREDYRIEEAP